MFVADETRKCFRCGRHRPLSEFSWRDQAKSKRSPYCKSCRAEYGRAHYQANRDVYISRARERNATIRAERSEFLRNYLLAHPCVDCGETDPIVLEFDHLHDKQFTVSVGLRDRNWETVLSEIEKCEVVCANCHRRRTTRRGGFTRGTWTD